MIFSRLSDALLALSPTRALCLLSAVQLCLWSLTPYLAFLSPPLDVVENLVWGAQWQWGYYKHPPLQAWLTEISWQAGGLLGIYIMSQLCIVATYWGIFLLGRDIIGAPKAVLGVLIYALCFYATVPTPELNANIVQAPFWAFAAWFLYRALTQNRPAYWFGLALMLTGGFYTKYSVVFLLAGLAMGIICIGKWRHSLRRPLLYLAATLCMALCAPHIIWLVQTDFQPLAYALARTKPLDGIELLFNPLTFLLAQILAYALPILLLLIAGAKRTRPKDSMAYLTALAFVPLLVMALWSALNGVALRTMWGAPAAIWLGLWLAAHIHMPTPCRRARTALLLGASLLLALPLAMGYASYASRTTPAPTRTAWDGAKLARLALADWQKITGTPAPELVIGPTWEAGLMAHFLPNRPIGFFGTAPANNPWVSPQAFKTAPALIVWHGDDREDFATLGGIAYTSREKIMYKGKQSYFHWGIRPASQN